MQTTIATIVISTLLATILASCNLNQITGKEKVVEQNLPLNNHFEELSVSNGWNVVLIPSKQQNIKVHANENLIDLLQAEVKDNTLYIASKEKKNIGRADAKKIEIRYTGTLKNLRTSSGSKLTSETVFNQKEINLKASSGSLIQLKLTCKNTAAKVSSGAKIDLEGTSIHFEGKSSSGGNLDAQNLDTKLSTVKASSGATIRIAVEEKITAKASSGGSIHYYGNPEETPVEEKSSGGSIKQHP